MDPITHTFAGAALAASGLRRRTPLATAALILGANAPDIDGCAYFAGSYTALAFRRGWTHGVLAVAVAPLIVTGLLLLWERVIRRRRQPAASPTRPAALLAVAAVGVATHPVLDWLNNYGIRLLMPFDGRWFYGDALFIVDPWVWLVLGGALCLGYSRRPSSMIAWSVFCLLASLLIWTVPSISPAARALWLAGVATVVAARALGFAAPRRGPAVERVTRLAVGSVCAYMTVAALASLVARTEVRAQLTALGIGPIQQVMVAPVLANPFAGQVVAETASDYYFGTWSWLTQPRFRPTGRRIPRLPRGPLFEAAAATPDARRFLVWSRFPYVEVESNAAGQYLVRFRDARYDGTGRLTGPTVRLCAIGPTLRAC